MLQMGEASPCDRGKGGNGFRELGKFSPQFPPEGERVRNARGAPFQRRRNLRLWSRRAEPKARSVRASVTVLVSGLPGTAGLAAFLHVLTSLKGVNVYKTTRTLTTSPVICNEKPLLG